MPVCCGPRSAGQSPAKGMSLSLSSFNPACCVPFQMTSSDKDFRFMATNDLMAELQKDSIKLDDDSERKVKG